MAVSFKCSECGKIIKGRNEYEAEIKFDQHECEGVRRIRNMSQEELEAKLKSEGRMV